MCCHNRLFVGLRIGTMVYCWTRRLPFRRNRHNVWNMQCLALSLIRRSRSKKYFRMLPKFFYYYSFYMTLGRFSLHVNKSLLNKTKLLLSLSSPLCRVFTIIYLKQTIFLRYIALQLFCIYSSCYM